MLPSALAPQEDRFRLLRAAARQRQLGDGDDILLRRWPSGGGAGGGQHRSAAALAEEAEPAKIPAADVAVDRWLGRLWPGAGGTAPRGSPLAVGVVQALLDAGIGLEGRLDAHLRGVLPRSPDDAAGRLDGTTDDQALRIADTVRRILVETGWGLPPPVPDQRPRNPPPRTAPASVPATSRVRPRALGQAVERRKPANIGLPSVRDTPRRTTAPRRRGGTGAPVCTPWRLLARTPWRRRTRRAPPSPSCSAGAAPRCARRLRPWPRGAGHRSVNWRSSAGALV